MVRKSCIVIDIVVLVVVFICELFYLVDVMVVVYVVVLFVECCSGAAHLLLMVVGSCLGGVGNSQKLKNPPRVPNTFVRRVCLSGLFPTRPFGFTHHESECIVSCLRSCLGLTLREVSSS